MGRTSNCYTLTLIFILGLLSSTLPTPTIIQSSSAELPDHIIISEILVSPNNEDYGGTDWNGDGKFGQYSDMFVEIHNPTNSDVNISNWVLEVSGNEGSQTCSVGWDTILPTGGYMVFYRADSGLEFDYFDGSTVKFSDPYNNLLDSFSFGGFGNDWDISYGRDSEGNWTNVTPPTPGIANDELWPTEDGGPGTNHLIGTCYANTDDLYHKGSYVLKGRIVTMESENSVIPYGGILVTDGMIEAVWEDGQMPSNLNLQNIPVVETAGTIYPGIIDAHNHMHYNMAPLWDYSLDHRNGDFYDNRYQWKNNPSYSIEVTGPKNLIQGWDYWDLEHESMKYVEVRAIAGGTTAVQGNPTGDDDEFATILARNIEYYNFGKDYMHTKVTELEDDYIGNHIKNGNQSGELDAWFLHLAEGTDESSRAEFDILVNNDLLVGELMLIHGTGLGQAEFAAMGAVGADLVWSPTSNLLLYGDTTDVVTAKSEGVTISLAPDWSPSGTKNPLHELKIADWLNENRFDNVFSDYELVQMVTSNPADGMNWGEYVGRIKTGLHADLMVVDSFRVDPYRNLIESIDPDVKLTIVGGLPLFGDNFLLTQLGVDGEVVQGNGFSKSVDVTFEGVSKGGQTWASISGDLENAMQFDMNDMYESFNYASSMTFTEFEDWFTDRYPGLSGGTHLDSVFTFGDDYYFDVLNRSVAFNDIGQIDLWSTYYNVELNDNGYRLNKEINDADSDEDGYSDWTDAFPDDPTEWYDSDNDGVGNNNDPCPNDPQDDSDNDGVCADLDDFPYDADETTDSDGDGVGDNSDSCPEEDASNYDDNNDGCIDVSTNNSNDDNSNAVCSFGQVKKEDCNDCVCSNSGDWVCTEKACEQSSTLESKSTDQTTTYILIIALIFVSLISITLFFNNRKNTEFNQWEDIKEEQVKLPPRKPPSED
ncbi:MAG: hypothetical protein CMB64_02500 [Euryarchaeota archaeon]|nr:hypothetical protein [Euryarchaeota archaeon]